MTITIIGGSGFIGTELTRQLLEAGETVRIADKARSATYPELWAHADVRDTASLSAALAGSDAIYNLAAEHKDNVQPRSLYDDVNVGGARNVCRAARELAIERIVFTSSVAVYGFAPPDTDESGRLSPFNDYGRTKLLAEAVYREWLEQAPGRALTIVRPTVVFGPRNRGNVYNLLNQMSSGRFAMVGSGENVKSMAFVENIAAFLAKAAGFGEGEHVYNYIDKPDLSMNELVALVKRRLGQSERIGLRIPYALGYAGGLALDGVARLTRRELPISAIRVKKFCATTQFRSSTIAGTGFIPPVSLRAGLDRTIDYELLGGRDRDDRPSTIFESE
ncbi:MAG TPA: NAD-dependent epimerase/dehydratase family protein [Spirochaetia bacterium]|nr:NAD-dependent epimerase/dehydratase family protein [Spirochaetia bacterium]